MMFQNSYDEMITLDDLCEMLSIGKNTAYQLLQTGQIHAFKIGRIWKIPRDVVAEFVERKSKTRKGTNTMNNESRNPKLYFENNYISPVPGFVANNENLVNAFHYDIRSNPPICQTESHRFLYYEYSSNPSAIYFWLDFTGYNFCDAIDFSKNFVMRFSVFTPVRCTMHRNVDHYYVRIAVS